MKIQVLTLSRYLRSALRRAARPRGSTGAASSRTRRLASLPTAVTAPAPARPELRVAVAAGDRLRLGLAWEWTQLELTPHNWQSVLANSQFHLLLVEIANGTIPLWNQQQTEALLQWTSTEGLTTAAWVTGASAEHELAHRWIGSVPHVFLSRHHDAQIWRSRFPGASFQILEPSAQPHIHNPAITGRAQPERAAALLIDEASPYISENLAHLGSEQIDLWPIGIGARTILEKAGFSRFLVPSAAMSKLNHVLGRYAVVADMAADYDRPWRIVEVGSAHTAAIVNAAALSSIPQDLHDFVNVVHSPEEFGSSLVAHLWQRELRDRAATRLAREIYQRHTFGHRVNQIAAATGIPLNHRIRPVSAIVSTNRPHELSNIFHNVTRQWYASDGNLELVLVLHGLDLRRADVEAMARDAGVENLVLIEADRSLTLGACLNLGLDAASGHYIAKMDDDNFYGRHYLTDLVAAFDYSGADIVGKWAHYVWLRSSRAVILRCARSEHRRVRLVQGGSIVMTRDVAHSLSFSDLPRGVDTDLLNRAYSSGVVTYSADRFNYISIRGADRHSHTWTIADTALMNRAGSIVFYGDPHDHVEV